MTVLAWVVCCAGLALAGVVAWRIDRSATTRADDARVAEARRNALERERIDRELALKEREVAVQERQSPAIQTPPPSEFPPELYALVENESEPWARDDMLQVISDGYVDAGGDWQRASVYIGYRLAMQPASRLPKHLS